MEVMSLAKALISSILPFIPMKVFRKSIRLIRNTYWCLTSFDDIAREIQECPQTLNIEWYSYEIIKFPMQSRNVLHICSEDFSNRFKSSLE
jgi:hypothetical protein